MSTRRILLIRHGESYKNVEDRHGGDGSSLKAKGQRQCHLLGQYIRQHCEHASDLVIIGHHIPQVAETAGLLAKELQCRAEWDERLKGLHLGVLSGLSRDEAMRKWPEAALLLELWRSHKLKINRLSIPGAEPIDGFRVRIEAALNDCLRLREERLLAIICTRSALIMMTNLTILGSAFDYEHYKLYDFSDASITEISVRSGSMEIVRLNSVEHLMHEAY